MRVLGTDRKDCCFSRLSDAVDEVEGNEVHYYDGQAEGCQLVGAFQPPEIFGVGCLRYSPPMDTVGILVH